MKKVKAFFAWVASLFTPKTPSIGPAPAQPGTPAIPSTPVVAPVTPASNNLANQPDLWITKALEITGSYEGNGWGAVSGDGDRQGLSCGILQWNFGQGTLQSQILLPYIEAYGSIDKLGIFPGAVDLVAQMSPVDALAYVRKNWLKGPGGLPQPSWALAWAKFLTTPQCMDIQKKGASNIGDVAMELCKEWGTVSPRAFCFFFDIVTQDGGMKGIKKPVANLNTCKKYILLGEAHNQKLWDTVAIDTEMNILFQAGYLRANVSNYFADTFARKGTIALGLGYVHGTVYTFDFTKL